MTTYLTIITTILVLTQIIRVTQNYLQLRNFKATDRKNDELIRDWKNIIEEIREFVNERQ